jgi:hypothetical protein
MRPIEDPTGYNLRNAAMVKVCLADPPDHQP